MTIRAIVTGRLVGAPQQRTSSAGNAYVLARLQVGDGEHRHLIGLFAFGVQAQRVLLALGEGAQLAATGELKVAIYRPGDGEPRANMTLYADAVMTLHERQRTDRAVRDARGGANQASAPAAPGRDATQDELERSQRQATALCQGQRNAGASGFDDMDNGIP